MRKTVDFWPILVRSIVDQDLGSFGMITGGVAPELANAPDEKGFTVLHHVAKNANAMSALALRHLIIVAKKNGVSIESLLNAKDPSGCTALTLCVTTGNSSNIYARVLLISELLIQGADPTIDNPDSNVLNRFSETDKEKIKKEATLKEGVLYCNKKIKDFVLEKRCRLTQKSSLTQLSLMCATQRRTISTIDSSPTPSR